jgi:competence protein ComEA
VIPEGPAATEAPVNSTELININIASQAELESLPGIGPTTAQKIIQYREQNGPFLTTEDIINVSGIGPGTYERIKDLITVGP